MHTQTFTSCTSLIDLYGFLVLEDASLASWSITRTFSLHMLLLFNMLFSTSVYICNLDYVLHAFSELPFPGSFRRIRNSPEPVSST
jgi:hypothetical protein